MIKNEERVTQQGVICPLYTTFGSRKGLTGSAITTSRAVNKAVLAPLFFSVQCADCYPVVSRDRSGYLCVLPHHIWADPPQYQDPSLSKLDVIAHAFPLGFWMDFLIPPGYTDTLCSRGSGFTALCSCFITLIVIWIPQLM